MSALTMKIPDPIMEPIVIAAESNRLRDFLNWPSAAILFLDFI
jgi:hypothetical protein